MLTVLRFNEMKYGWWSDNLSTRMPDLDFKDVSDNLQRKLSISVPILCENRVGKVISGEKPIVVK